MKHKLLLFQTDFGRLEGTVAEMYGVALGVDPELKIHEITHYIPQFNIWEASYRLVQALPYWPEGTVAVSVVDPGVGSERKSVAARTAGGHFVVTPDNGTLTHLDRRIGITALREIDEKVNRRPCSGESHTFHGRDVYGYTGARLAAGLISFEEAGPELDPSEIVRLPVLEPSAADGIAEGIIDIPDTRYGNLWTNIPKDLFDSSGFAYGDRLDVAIEKGGKRLYHRELPYTGFFSAVEKGEDLVYNNELLYVSLSTNQGNFAEKNGIQSGPGWKIRFRKV
jgi:S-adenosylmethionine hydrolase